MGWSSGSELASKMIALMELVADDGEQLREAFQEMIRCFEDFDCDTLQECIGESKTFDLAFKMMYPEHYEELTNWESV